MNRITALAVLLLAAGDAGACPGLVIEDAWIRESPPGATVMAGYARLHNDSRQTLTVRAVSSPAFGGAELHRTVVEQGVSRMLRDQTLALAPGARAELAPGGWHLMLFRPRQALKAGDAIEIAFGCGAEARSYPFTVQRK